MAGPASSLAPDHRSQLDTLRFLAFLGVFVFHVDEDNFTYGALGVPLFFVLSGFLITRLLLVHETGDLKHDLGVFYARRTLRIFPLYYLVLVVLLLAGRLDHPVWSFLYLHNVVMFLREEPGGLTGHFWSLSVEEQFYLAYPLILLLTPARNRGPLLMTLLTGSLLTRLTLAALYPQSRYWTLLPVAGESLVWGCFAGLYEASGAPRCPRAGWLLLGGLLLHGLATADQYALHLVHAPGCGGLYQTLNGTGFALLVLGLWRLSSGWALSLLGLAPLVYLGRISYGLYVIHPFCYGLGARLDGFPVLGAVPDFVIAFVVTVSLAMLSWHLFEAPINRLKGLVPYRRSPRPVPVERPAALPELVAVGGRP
jgi:peptidoglycan/LPS O-acetylase OafA/YrhL